MKCGQDRLRNLALAFSRAIDVACIVGENLDTTLNRAIQLADDM